MNAEMKDRKIQPGVLSNTVGIICNIALFLIKTVLAYLSGSVAVLSDAFNNLSDCLSNIISLFGYRISSRPADREHPYGHGRVEYLVSLEQRVLSFCWHMNCSGKAYTGSYLRPRSAYRHRY